MAGDAEKYELNDSKGTPIDESVVADSLRLNPRTRLGELRKAQLDHLIHFPLHAAIEEAFTHPSTANITVARIEGSGMGTPVLDVVTGSHDEALQLFGKLPDASGMQVRSMWPEYTTDELFNQ